MRLELRHQLAGPRGGDRERTRGSDEAARGDDGGSPINALSVYSPTQDAWAFGPDATRASIEIRDNLFEDNVNTTFADDLGDASFVFQGNTVRGANRGPWLSGTFPYACFGWAWFPTVVDRSPARIAGNHFEVQGNPGAILTDECAAHGTVAATIEQNTIQLPGPGGTGIWALGTTGATVRGNLITGSGDTAITVILGEAWTILQEGLGDFAAATADIVLDHTNHSVVTAPGAQVIDDGIGNTIDTGSPSP